MDWIYFLVWNFNCLGWREVYLGIPQHSHLKLYYPFLLEGLWFHCEIGENFRKTTHFWLGFTPPCEVALCICTKQVRIYPSFCCGTVNENFKLCKGWVILCEVPYWNLYMQSYDFDWSSSVDSKLLFIS